MLAVNTPVHTLTVSLYYVVQVGTGIVMQGSEKKYSWNERIVVEKFNALWEDFQSHGELVCDLELLLFRSHSLESENRRFARQKYGRKSRD
jgi:hypothetical protein